MQSKSCSCCALGSSRRDCSIPRVPCEMQRKGVEKWSLSLSMYERTTRDKWICDLKSNMPNHSLIYSALVNVYCPMCTGGIWESVSNRLKILWALNRASSFIYSPLKTWQVSLPSGRGHFSRSAILFSSQELESGQQASEELLCNAMACWQACLLPVLRIHPNSMKHRFFHVSGDSLGLQIIISLYCLIPKEGKSEEKLQCVRFHVTLTVVLHHAKPKSKCNLIKLQVNKIKVHRHKCHSN